MSRLRALLTKPSQEAIVNRVLKGFAVVYLVWLIAAVMAYKTEFIQLMFSNLFFGIYSTCVTVYILSRFLFSLFYRSKPDRRGSSRAWRS